MALQQKLTLTWLESPSLVGALPTTPDSDGSSWVRVSMIRQVDVMPGVRDANPTETNHVNA